MAVSELKPGLRLARTLFSHDGVMLLNKGYVLDDLLIRQLKKYEESAGKLTEIWVATP
jgi:hypothetical protein